MAAGNEGWAGRVVRLAKIGKWEGGREHDWDAGRGRDRCDESGTGACGPDRLTAEYLRLT